MQRPSPTKRGRSPQMEGKAGAIQRRLRDLALQSGPSAKLPTIDAMCAAFEASRTTVVDALNQLEAQNVILRQRGSGIYVSPKLFQKDIALVIGGSAFSEREASPFWYALWSGFLLHAQERGEGREETLSIHIIRTKAGRMQPLDDQLAQRVEAGRIDGVLGVGLDYDTAAWLRDQGVPVVAFAGSGQWHVVLDAAAEVQLASQHLIGAGCRSIRLWIAGGEAHARPDPRQDPDQLGAIQAEALDRMVRPFREAIRRAGLPLATDAVFIGVGGTEPRKYERQGYAAFERLLHQGQAAETDGLIIMNDLMTVGALKAMLHYGAGHHIQIISHANRGVSLLSIFEERIARIEMDPAAIVARMYGLLDAVLAGEVPAEDSVTLGPSGLLLPQDSNTLPGG